MICCARTGGLGQGQHLFWRHISQSEIRKIAVAKKETAKAKAGKNSFPPTPFLFARPSDWISEFAVRIFVKKSSDFNQKAPPSFTFSIMKKDRQQGELSWDSVIKNFLITAFNREMKMILKLNRGKATKGKPDSSMFGTQ